MTQVRKIEFLVPWCINDDQILYIVWNFLSQDLDVTVRRVGP